MNQKTGRDRALHRIHKGQVFAKPLSIVRTRTAVSSGVARLSEGCHEDLLIYEHVYGQDGIYHLE